MLEINFYDSNFQFLISLVISIYLPHIQPFNIILINWFEDCLYGLSSSGFTETTKYSGVI